MRRTLARLIAIAVVLLVAVGCDGQDGLAVERWTLRAGEHTEEILLPIHVTDRLPRTRSQYVLSSRVALPNQLRNRELELVFPSFVAPLTLRADGHQLRELDRRDPRALRAVGPHVWVFQTSGRDVVDLEITVEHRWTQSAWIDTVPFLRPALPGSAPNFVVSVSSLGGYVALGTLLPFGFAYLVLFLLDRRRLGAFFFVQAISGSYYPLYVLGLSDVLGPFDLPLLTISQVLAPIAGLRVTFEKFGLGKLPPVFPVMVIVSIALAGVWMSPFTALNHAVVVVGCGSVTLSYHLYRLLPLTRDSRVRRNATVLVVAWAAVVVGLISDAPMFLGQGEPFGGVRLGCWGLTINALGQAVALVVDHVQSLRRTEDLNEQLTRRIAELEARSQENALLDAELRHQITTRSEALSRALSRLPREGTTLSELKVGDLIDQRYSIRRPIGAGGMGTVYSAVRVTDDRRVALKVMKRSSTPERTARFAREAMLGSKVRHPNVVPIIDLGVSQDGVFYLVMDLVDGISLAKVSSGKPASSIVDALAQTARGLLAIHAANVVHRDLKPTNILIEERTGLVKITDFGISIAHTPSDEGDREPPTVDDPTYELARIAPPPRPKMPAHIRAPAAPEPETANDADPRLTATGVAIGTPLYSAPEVMAGKRAGREADVYALGVMSIELLSGVHPLRDARALPLAAARIPTDMFALLRRSLSPDAAERPSVEELAWAFEDFVGVQAIPADEEASARRRAKHERGL